MENKPEIEQLKQQEEVKTALKQTTGTKETAAKPVVNVQDKLWFGTYVLFALGFLAIHYLLGVGFFTIATAYVELLRGLLMGSLLIVLVLAFAKSIRVYLIDQIENIPARDNLTRVLNLLAVLAIVLIALSVLFAT